MLVSDSEADFIRGMTTLGSHSRVERLGLTPKTTWKHGDSESSEGVSGWKITKMKGNSLLKWPPRILAEGRSGRSFMTLPEEEFEQILRVIRNWWCGCVRILAKTELCKGGYGSLAGKGIHRSPTMIKDTLCRGLYNLSREASGIRKALLLLMWERNWTVHLLSRGWVKPRPRAEVTSPGSSSDSPGPSVVTIEVGVSRRRRVKLEKILWPGKVAWYL